MKLDSAGGEEWSKDIRNPANGIAKGVQELEGGGYIGCALSTSLGVANASVLKLSASGEVEWGKVIGGTGGDLCSRVSVSEDGEYIYFIGTSTSFGVTTPQDGFAGKIRVDDGSLEWATLVSLGERYNPGGITTTKEGNLLLSGTYIGPASNDISLVELSAHGQLVSSWIFNYGNHEISGNVESVPSGGYALAGATLSVGSGSYDLLFIKLGEDLSYCGLHQKSSLPISVTDLTYLNELVYQDIAYPVTDASLFLTFSPITPVVLDAQPLLYLTINDLCTAPITQPVTSLSSDDCACTDNGLCSEGICVCSPSFTGSLCQFPLSDIAALSANLTLSFSLLNQHSSSYSPDTLLSFL